MVKEEVVLPIHPMPISSVATKGLEAEMQGALGVGEMVKVEVVKAQA